jgi:hypothetical protein
MAGWAVGMSEQGHAVCSVLSPWAWVNVGMHMR